MAKAVELYTAPGHPYNCAQAVAIAAGHPELEAEMKACGGGRAPEGRCGALHAAMTLLPPELHQQLLEEFAGMAGALTCREIKGGGRTSCSDCVALAEVMLQRYTSRPAAEA